jgi:Spy/CpxP family protein refolding chaperone
MLKDHLRAFIRTRFSLGAAGIALAFALGGCSGSTSGAGGDAAGSTTAGASTAGGGAAANGRHRMAEALMGLGLSDAQKTQIRDIMSAARKQSEGADPATRRANYKAAFAKIDDVLTPDQRAKMHAKMDEMRKEREASAPPQS